MPSPDHLPSPPFSASHWRAAMSVAFRDRPARAALLTIWPLAGLVLLIVSVWALGYVERWRPVTALTAQVYRAEKEPIAERIVTSLDPLKLASDAGLDPRAPFEVEWRGLLVVEDEGTHRLRVRADDGVAMWVGDQQVLDEVTNLGEQHVTAPVHLTRGLHPFRLRYIQRGGEGLIRLSWAVPSSREEFHAVPVVVETDPPPVFRRMDKALRYPRQLAIAWSAWLLTGLMLTGVLLAELAAQARLAALLSWPNAVALIVISGALLGANLEVGLQPFQGWAPDEVQPRDVYFARASAFGGGWYHQYPPLPFYLFAIVNAPFTVLEHWGRLSFTDPLVYADVHLVDRGVILGFAILTCVALLLLACRLIGARAAVFAPYALIGVPIVAFYSKTTNVDAAYMFWIVIAALAFVRAVTTRTVGDHVWLGVAAAAAVASKDQAYGFFPGAALVLLWLTWRHAGGALSSRLRRTLTSPALWAGLVAFAACYTLLLGVWWNAEGVRQHFHVITGQASAPFRMFPGTAAGMAELAGTTMMLVGLVVGPVIGLAAIIGLGLSASERPIRPELLLMSMPLGYLVTFVGVVGYVYDRFLLAVVPFVVLLAARGLDWALGQIRRPEWRSTITVVAIGALLYPAVALNARLAGDSRFGVEAWMGEHLTNDPSVLAVGSQLYLPNLHPYQHRIVQRASVAEILTWDADVLVLNEDWLERPGQPSDETIERELGEARYRRALATGRTGPPVGLGGIVASGLTVDSLFSNIAKTSPPISIWVRDSASRDAASSGAVAAPAAGGDGSPPDVVATLSLSPPPGLTGRVVFHSSREGRNKLYTLDVATGAVMRLTSGADHHDEDPSWSRDGGMVAFATNRFDHATFDIAVTDRRGASVSRVTSHAAFEQHPTWASDGRTVLFSSEQDGTQAVFEARLDGTAVTRLSEGVERALMPAEAPGGRRLSFTKGTAEGLQVLLHDRESNTDRALTGGPIGAAWPRWSPDGSRLAYYRLGNPGRYIEVLDVASSRAVTIRVEGLATLSDPDWSPDGRFLVAAGAPEAGDAADWDLVLLNVETPGRAFRLTTGAGNDRAPSWTAR